MRIKMQESDPPVDILDIEDHYVCSCKVNLYNDQTYQFIRIPGKNKLPILSKGSRIKAHSHEPALIIKGTVSLSTKDTLNITDINVTSLENKRKNIRYTIQEPCCFFRQNKLYTGRLVNISLSGACIKSKSKLKITDDVTLKFMGLKIPGTIIRIMPQDDIVEYGIVFKTLPQETFAILSHELK